MPLPLPTIDISAVELTLRMTEGDPLAFRFVVSDAESWAAGSYSLVVYEHLDEAKTPLLSGTVVSASVSTDPAGCEFLITGSSSGLLAGERYDYWLQELGGSTRFHGPFEVEAK